MATGITPLSGPPKALAELIAASPAWEKWLIDAAAAAGKQAPDPASRIHRSDAHKPDRPFAEIYFEPGLRIARRQSGGNNAPIVSSESTLSLFFEAERATDTAIGLEADMDAFAVRVEQVLVDLLDLCRPAGKPDLAFELAQPMSINVPENRGAMGHLLQIGFRVTLAMP